MTFVLLAGACAAEEDVEEAVEDAGAAVEATADEAMATGADMTEDMASEMMTEDMASEAMTEDMASEAMTEDMASEMMTEDMASEAMTEDMASEAMTEDEMTEAASAAGDSSEICDADALVEAVEGGSEEGTLAGMADDPVGTAASNNPVLTTLTQAATAAGLVDTLNSAEALTVFAPTDCAFAQVDPATLDAAMADPSGLLTTVLGFHVIPGEMIASADLGGEYTTFTEETLTVDGMTVDGQAEIVVPDVETANATVHLIDTVMMPPGI